MSMYYPTETVPPTELVDLDGDGFDDTAAFDNLADGEFVTDVVAVDTTGDGYADVVADDTDLDGIFETVSAVDVPLADANPYATADPAAIYDVGPSAS